MVRLIDHYRAMIEGDAQGPPIARFVGFKLVRVEEGTAELVMRCKEDMVNSIGVVQGGMIATLADASMGMAAGTLMDEERSATTVELNINYIRPVRSGEEIRAVGKVIHPGRQIIVADCEVLNDAGKIVARATSTLVVVQKCSKG